MPGEILRQILAILPSVDRLLLCDRDPPYGLGALQDREGIGHRPRRGPAEIPSHTDHVEGKGIAAFRHFREDDRRSHGAEYHRLGDALLKSLPAAPDTRYIVAPVVVRHSGQHDRTNE